MCGIAGLLARGEGVDVSTTLCAMLQALRGRGPDSTGVSLYGAGGEGDLLASVYAGDGAAAAERLRAAAGTRGRVLDEDLRGGYVRMALKGIDGASPAALEELSRGLEGASPGARVFSLGRRLELLKDTVDAETLFARFGLAGRRLTHGIGHVRMATESRVDVAHSHPFWARPFPDVTVVHNGHITNYHLNRRKYEMRGHRFQTGNDTEFLAVYLADRMAGGLSLEEAVRASIDDLDGSFTYLVSTAEGFGVARDRFSTKPCLVAEGDGWVAVVSEGIALAGALGEDADYEAYELPGGEARAWTR